MKASDAAALLTDQLGCPYVWGANGPGRYDCSGLAYWWYNATGNRRRDMTASSLYNTTVKVTTPRLGDLVFLHSSGYVSHVGIMLNADTVIEARGRAFGVVRTPLAQFKSRGGYTFMGIRRDPLFTLEPDPVTVPPATTYRFNVGFGAQENARFGGLPSPSAARVAKLHQLLYLGIVGVTEADSAMIKAILATYRHHRVTLLSTGTVGVLTDIRKWSARPSRQVLHGDGYHGAVCQPVISVENGSHVDIIVNHTRPKSVASRVEKEADVRRAISLKGTWPCIITGDFAMNADDLMKTAGLRRISPNTDTYDPFGDDRIDATYGCNGITLIKSELRDPGSISDHKWLYTKVEIDVPVGGKK